MALAAWSWTIYYVLDLASATGNTAPPMALINTVTGQPAGFDNGDGTWLVRPSELNNLALFTAQFTGSPVTLNFTVTSVALDDGTLATSSAPASFSLVVDPGVGGTAGAPPPVPTVVVANLLPGTEDVSGALGTSGSPVVTAGVGTMSVVMIPFWLERR